MVFPASIKKDGFTVKGFIALMVHLAGSETFAGGPT